MLATLHTAALNLLCLTEFESIHEGCNGDAQDQQRKIDQTELREFSLPMFASSELPAAKPDPRAFASACRFLDVEPNRCLMVGDSMVNDVRGARGAGLPAVLLDRTGRTVPKLTGLAVVRSLHEIKFR